uniref:Transcriptional regulator n=1 Tax=Parastrongyloides trichosuri TaxID=131310 RepID=A0A0N4ZJJ8_PARTI
MAEGHRLCGLQMGEARHNCCRVLFCTVQQGALQILQLRHGAVAGVAHPQAEVRRHLIIAAARGVQAPRRLADQLGQAGLDVHVDVFIGVAEGEGPVPDLALDDVQPAQDGLGVRRRDDPLFLQHATMGPRTGQVLRPQAFIDADGDVDGLHDVGGLGAEARIGHERLWTDLGGRGDVRGDRRDRRGRGAAIRQSEGRRQRVRAARGPARSTARSTAA